MMSDKKVDVTMFMDVTINPDQREQIRGDLIAHNGVYSAVIPMSSPHLMVIEYNPDDIAASDLVALAQSRGVNASLIGF